MAKTLSKINVQTGEVVEAHHISQSIDAFTGTEAYDITLSGSLTVTGSLKLTNLPLSTPIVALGLTSTGEVVTGSLTPSTTTLWESGSSGIFSIRAKNDSGLDATGDYSYSEGYNTIASGTYSHAEGYNTTAEGNFSSHAEGYNTISSGGGGSHAEGSETTASGEGSHAEGRLTIASGEYSHSEGQETLASGQFSHAEGILSIASGNVSSASGLKSNTFGVVARRSHSSGNFGNLTFNNAQTSKLVLTGVSQNNTPYILRSSYPDAVTVNSILVLQNYNSIHFKGSIVGSTANNTNRVAWNIEGFITRGLGAATTTMIMNNVSVIDNTIGWGTPTLEADTTLGGLIVKVIGEATTTIAWVCVIHTTEIIY